MGTFPLLEEWKMKRTGSKSVWRPVNGAIVVGAMAFAVAAYSAPRTTDEAARGTNKGKTEVTRLVTGDPAQINAVVAGTPPTAKIQLVPRPTGFVPYPAGTTVVGSELSSSAGGFRAWFDFQVGDWDPDNNGTIPAHPGTVEITVDGMGYLDADTSDPGTSVLDDGDQPNLVEASTVVCANNAACVTAFGDAWAKCEAGFCKASYQDKLGVHPGGSYCDDFGAGTCNQGDCASNIPGSHKCFAITEAPRPDDGTMKYFASHVLDIPAGAKGRYTVGLVIPVLASSTSPPVGIDLLVVSGFTVNIRTGSCCSDLSNPSGSTCGASDDGVLKSECVDAAGACVGGRTGPCIWSDGKACADGCVECVNDGGCNDNDACTIETCNAGLGVCVRGSVAGYVAGTCCNPATGAIAVAADTNACTDDTCSLDPVTGTPKPGNGVPTHTVSSASTPCDDQNPCTTLDHCTGGTSTACTGTDINTIACPPDCPLDSAGVPRLCVAGLCFCTATPDLDFVIAGKDEDNNCFVSGNDGVKVTAVVRIGAAAAPINGGQFLMTYDPSCLDYISVAGVAPYTTTVYGPIVNESAGTIFIAVGVNPFGGADGPLGNADILSLSFKKVGECNECDLCFTDNNPQSTYLVDDEGQKVGVEGHCKSVRALGDLVLVVPDNIKTNIDCDRPTASESWAKPTASFSCGTTSLTCRGVHETGLAYSQILVMNGGVFPVGSSSFCCNAVANDVCDQAIGCAGATNDCAPGFGKPEGCWTVEVNDETSLDIDVQLCPPLAVTGELTRCIKFCLFENCIEDPICFSDDVTFGGLFNFIGKSQGKVKIPGSGQWDCITAQDQLHTLRSCYTFVPGDCSGGQLHADFTGDGLDSENCLVGGNLDGWKKDDPAADPSLDVIDILDFGTFVATFGSNYGSGNTPCGTPGPNGDINGDGKVDLADYNFLLRNYLVSAKDCCCGPQAASLPPALVEVSIDELRQMGQGDLAVADLNGDGVLNADDMDAFMQGARPAKSNDRKGGKGLRSGR
jgi:hypothetical protein